MAVQPPFFDSALAIPNSAAAGSTHDLDVPPPAGVALREGRALVTVHNPGAVAVTVRLLNRETLAGSARFPEILTFGVPAGGTASRVVEGWLAGESPSRFRASPDAAVGAAAGFNLSVRARRL